MTTYFTPVGSLPENTRAKGSQINDREAAVTTGFTALEAAIAATGVVALGTNWLAGVGGFATTALVKDVNDTVTLTLALQASGAPGSNLFTLPAGFRPTGIVYATGVFIDFSEGGAQYPCYVRILADGTSTFDILPAPSGISSGTGDNILLNVSFAAA